MTSKTIDTVKFFAQKALNRDGFTYNGLVWIYALITRQPTVSREAYMRMWKDSRFNDDELWMAKNLPVHVLEKIIEEFQPKDILDVGCGLGLTLEYAQQRGLEIIGLEGSAVAIKSSPVSKFIRHANLNKPIQLGRKFDLVWSVEVAEHIHPKFTSVFMDTLTNHGDLILLSAAPPGQGGSGHFNEQPQLYWIELMKMRSFDFESEITSFIQAMGDIYCENMMLFRHQSTKQIKQVRTSL